MFRIQAYVLALGWLYAVITLHKEWLFASLVATVYFGLIEKDKIEPVKKQTTYQDLAK